ncbi:MAG: TetR/AcrR family transcriptional regulator [Actinomycetota bacterium]
MTERVRDPDAKRQAVVAAAAARFTDVGFRAASTASIASSAGVAEGTVFHHFGSKHGLLEAVIAAEVSAFVSPRLRAPDPIDWPDFVGSTFDWVDEHRLVARVWSEGDDLVVGAMRRGMHRAVVPALSAALEAGQLAGWCRGGDAEWYAQGAFAVVGEALVVRALSGSGPSASEVARIVAAIVSPV